MSYHRGTDILGSTYVGDEDIWSKLINAAAEGGKMGVAAVQKSNADKAASAESAKRLSAALEADQNATSAMTAYLSSKDAAERAQSAVLAAPSDTARVDEAKGRVAKAEVDKMASDQMSAVQDAAAVGLPPDAAAKRFEKAQAAYAAALKAAQAAPTDPYKKAAVQAAQATMTKAANNQVAPKTPTAEEQAKADAILQQYKQSQNQNSFLTQPTFWVAAVGGLAVVGGGLALLLRRR